MSRTTLVLAAAIALLLAAAGCSRDEPEARGTQTFELDPATRSPAFTASATAPSGPVELVMENYRFVPSRFTLTGPRRLTIRNRGTLLHNFTVAGTSIDLDVQPGAHVTTQALALSPGEYTFFCRYHRAGYYMQGIFVAG